MRKVLSFVLVLSLVLGSFSMAFAADANTGLSDIAGNANEDAIQVAYDLEIVTGNPDGTFLPEKAVTRAEFAAMITRAMAIPQSALAGYAQTSFKDTTGYGWAVPYLAFCNSKGIMLGDGAGNAMPGRTITVNEAMTMALRAIGYTSNSAELVGAWPANYVTLAQNLSLYDDVASTTTVNKASAAQIIYNVLDEDLVAVDADGKTDEILKGGETQSLLTTGLGCTKDNGGYAYVFTKSDADTAKINANKYIGALVKSFSDDGDVVAVAVQDSVFLTGSYDYDDEEFDVDGTVYNLDDTNIDYTKTASNGDETSNTTPAAFTNGSSDTFSVTPGAVEAMGTVTLAAKVSGKTIKEVYSVNAWEAEEAFQFDADMLDDTKLNGYAFTEDDDDNIDVNSFTLLGVSSVDKIADDAVVEVFLADPSTSSSKIVKVTVGTETVSGRITLVDGNDYTIGGKVYAKSGGFSSDMDDLTLGDKGTAYLNYDGEISLWEIEDADSDNYAIVSDDFTSVGRDQTIVLVDKTGTEKEYVVTSDVIDGAEFTTGTAAAPTSVGALAIGDLVTFSLDKNGKIDAMKSFSYDGGTSTSALQVNKNRTLFGNVKLDSGVVVFTYDDTTLAASDFSVMTLANVEAEKNLTNTYYFTDGGKVKVMVIKDKFTGAEAKYAVLNSSSASYNDADDKVMLIKGLVGGNKYEALTADRDILNPIDTATATAIYKLTVDADGVVTDAETAVSEIAVVNGSITDKDGNYLIQVAGAWCTIDPNAVVYQYDTGADSDEDVWSAKKVSDVKKAAGSDPASYVYLYQFDDDSEVYDFIVIVK